MTSKAHLRSALWEGKTGQYRHALYELTKYVIGFQTHEWDFGSPHLEKNILEAGGFEDNILPKTLGPSDQKNPHVKGKNNNSKII